MFNLAMELLWFGLGAYYWFSSSNLEITLGCLIIAQLYRVERKLEIK